jgi:hypothetical protein
MMDIELHRTLYSGNKCKESVLMFCDAYEERQRIEPDLWDGL